MSSNLLAKGYEPSDVEKRWSRYWEENKMFTAKEQSNQKSYSIVIPPPNVTGVLHMGHALNITLQDILCRYRRLLGDNVLWMPGTDHAGIATQNVVEKQLAGENTSRHELGRETFIERVWQWREQYGNKIINQLKRLGASCDWDRERFTMDEGLSRAVRTVFVKLYEDGLIYRGSYIINWCHRCHTALADLEVDHEDHQGHLYHIRYPFINGNGGIVVATTRPETMLGDTAVAVHPEDGRYLKLPSEKVILPLMNKPIPIIRDQYVAMDFGTGALKITPAHDPNDFEVGIRHNLPRIKVIGDDGLMTDEAGDFKGLERFECRKAVVAALEKEGFLVKIEPHQHSVGHCYRCKTVVEPNLSMQWFVRAKPLAKKALDAVKNKETKIIPEMWIKTYNDWLENIRDWCISRQIWWGHQIPAWTCQNCGNLIVAMEDPESCKGCGKNDLVRETDVLDTWFSSALWPFSTMGWPDQTPLLKTFYPTSVLVTGFDILFFWVARMMMMGIQFMGEVPFKDVYVHALVRDEDGKKMSKSKGNVIDPLVVIDEYGTDAFRFTLAAFAAQGRDVKMSEKRVEGYRHFVNKLWNAARFALMHVDKEPESIAPESLPDRWILSRLNRVSKSVSDALDNYRFNEAASELYQFIWHEFCDWYIEAIKPVLYGKLGENARESTKGVLWLVLRNTLTILHPFMPFVTEEIRHKLPGTEGSIMTAAYPSKSQDFTVMVEDKNAETEMSLIVDIITGIRNIRGEMNISPSQPLDVKIQARDTTNKEIILTHQDIITDLARLDSLSVHESEKRPKTAAASIVTGAVIYVSLEGIIDFEKETQRLEKEINKLSKELISASKKLHNEDFLKKAPPEVVEKVKEKHDTLCERQHKLKVNLERINALHGE
jgi:valyl-tRNA synthetase